MQTFNFDNFFKYNTDKKRSLAYENDLIWLIGFAEGDGSWYVDIKSNRTYFIINQKDPKVLYKVRGLLGFGKIRNYKTNFRFSVTDQKGTFNIIQLFNGNLVLNKTRESFVTYIKIFNQTKKNNLDINLRAEIIFHNNILIPTLNDAWFSGFIDAEGCFSFDKRRGLNISALRFHLTQYNEIKIMQNLAIFFEVNLVTFFNKVSPEKSFLRFYLQEAKINILLNYIEKYTLYSEKTIILAKFKKILYRLTDNRDHNLRRSHVRFARLIDNLNKLS